MAPAADTDPSGYNIPGISASIGVVPVSSNPTTNLSIVNLIAGGATVMDFNIDGNPILDVIVFADQIITVNVYVRTSPTDTFRLLDNAAQGVGVANQMKQPVRGLRVGGSQARVEFVNNSGVPTTVFVAEATFRGF
jgi:hypothetical protein